VPSISAIFWDVGGVLLSNAWDHNERKEAFAKFELDAAEFDKRHEPIVASFETGTVSLDQYLDQTVFYRERTFTRDDFKQFMYSCSRPKRRRSQPRAWPCEIQDPANGDHQQRIA
jgi:putative hydrolase of the HAD superfamily